MSEVKQVFDEMFVGFLMKFQWRKDHHYFVEPLTQYRRKFNDCSSENVSKCVSVNVLVLCIFLQDFGSLASQVFTLQFPNLQLSAVTGTRVPNALVQLSQAQFLVRGAHLSFITCPIIYILVLVLYLFVIPVYIVISIHPSSLVNCLPTFHSFPLIVAKE